MEKINYLLPEESAEMTLNGSVAKFSDKSILV